MLTRLSSSALVLVVVAIMFGATAVGILIGRAAARHKDGLREPLGVVEAAGVGLFGGPYRDAYSFVVLMVVLILRPRGLLGERVAEKV